MAKYNKTGGRQKGTPNKKTAYGSKAELYWKGIVTGVTGPLDKRGESNPNEIAKYKKTVKDYFMESFHEIQSDPELNLTAFARAYPQAYYQMALKLIPQEISANVSADLSVTFNIQKTYEAPPSLPDAVEDVEHEEIEGEGDADQSL